MGNRSDERPSARALARLPLKDFAIRQLAGRLARVEFEWSRCAECSGAGQIHDLRVSLRRFGETLWLFRRLFPGRERKQVRAELKTVLGFAGDTRDVDIALESFEAAGIALAPEVRLYLDSARATAEAGLVATLAVGSRTAVIDRWRQSLSLGANTAQCVPLDGKRVKQLGAPQCASAPEAIVATGLTEPDEGTAGTAGLPARAEVGSP